MKNKKLQKDRLRSRILLLIVFLIIAGIYKIAYDIFFLEDFCDNQARQIVGKEWTKDIPATQLDKDRWSSIIHNGKIYWGMHEVLVCEDKHKAFIFF